MASFLEILLNIIGVFLRLLFKVFGVNLINFIGSIWSPVAWYIFKGKRNIVEEELRLLFGTRFDDNQIKRITKKSFVNYYRRQIEYLFFGYLSKGTIEKMVSVDGLENLDLALSRGKGVILLLSHFGSFLLPLPFLGYRGYKVNQVTGRQKHSSLIAEKLWLWRKKEADRLPVKFIQVGRFLRPIYNALGNNEIVAIAFDGREGTNWVETEFMGKKALFSFGPFILARKTGAVIIPTFIIRTKDNTHRLILEPPFRLSAQSDINSALCEDTQQFAGLFAKYVSEFPCHFGGVLGRIALMYKAKKGFPLFVK